MAKITDIRGREITIAISGKGDAARARRRYAAEPSKRRPGFLPRRAKAGAVEFYDLGLLGDLSTIATIATAPETWPPEPVADLTETYDQIRDQILAQGASGWFAASKKITKNSAIGQSLRLSYTAGGDYIEGTLPELPEFGDKGLELPPEGLATLAVELDSFYSAFVFNDGELTKVTSGPTYESDPVEFELAGKAAIGIAPALIYQDATVTYLSPNFTTDVLNGFHGIIPRAAAPFVPIEETEYAEAVETWRMYREHPQARAFREDHEENVTVIAPANFAPGSHFPMPPGEPDGGFSIDQAISAPPERALLAIVRQSGQIFYLWKAVVP